MLLLLSRLLSVVATQTTSKEILWTIRQVKRNNNNIMYMRIYMYLIWCAGHAHTYRAKALQVHILESEV